MTHICVSKLTIIGPVNGLWPGRRQAIIWTNAGILLIGPLGTNVSEILIEIYTFSFKKMHLNISFGKWRPFCLGLIVLKRVPTCAFLPVARDVNDYVLSHRSRHKQRVPLPHMCHKAIIVPCPHTYHIVDPKIRAGQAYWKELGEHIFVNRVRM